MTCGQEFTVATYHLGVVQELIQILYYIHILKSRPLELELGDWILLQFARNQLLLVIFTIVLRERKGENKVVEVTQNY